MSVADSSEFVDVKDGGVRRGEGNLKPVVSHVRQVLFQFGSIASLDSGILFYSIKSTVSTVHSSVLAFTKIPAIDLVNGQRARSMSLTFRVNSGVLMPSHTAKHRGITCLPSLPAFM